MKKKSGSDIATKSVRKEWDINPVTRIKESKKKYKRSKKIEFED